MAKMGKEETEDKLRNLLKILMHVPSGRDLIARAQGFWSMSEPFQLVDKIRWGNVSKTDAVITRYLNTKTGKERIERKVIIILKKDQKIEDLALDLAHELVHATTRAELDPYDPNLTAQDYVQVSIEGRGGEVDAIIAECQISFELHSKFPDSNQRCRSYIQGSLRKLDRKKILRDFYRVGDWHDEFTNRMGNEIQKFPWLSSQSPELYSSTRGAPYPIALLQEYEELTRIACENSEKRLSQLQSSAEAQSQSQLFLERRCKI